MKYCEYCGAKLVKMPDFHGGYNPHDGSPRMWPRLQCPNKFRVLDSHTDYIEET